MPLKFERYKFLDQDELHPVSDAQATFDAEYDFSLEDDILVCVTPGTLDMEYVTVIETYDAQGRPAEKNGSCVYEECETGTLDYMVELVFTPPCAGVFVLEKAKVAYTRGDWAWGEDDDAELGFERVRRATFTEIRDCFGGSRWQVLKDVLVMWWHRKLIEEANNV